MRILLLLLFVPILAIAAALGQMCDRTLTVAGNPEAPPGLDIGDFEATVSHKRLIITKVEPIHYSRVLILIRAIDQLSHKESKQLIRRLTALTAIPPNVKLAYGVYAEKIIFSERFTSDPDELRTSLGELVQKANSGILGKRDAGYYVLGQALDFFQKPLPGDSIVELVTGVIDSYDDYSEIAKKSNINPITITTFLEKGIRLFAWENVSISAVDSGWSAVFAYEELAEATGGAVFSIQSDNTWLNYLIFGMNQAYLVTVSVPSNVRAEARSWRLRLSNSKRRRLHEAKSDFDLLYPDLLLCNSIGPDAGSVRR